ncbi:MFS transporter [Sediminicola luteus]|uniref:Major facilitator superfamily (MFS) profile domain-containing protein n=1 Tax=Sediminicola luteus TaxID=319238 RepID=A0A2A4GBN2_9FLAO|nr:MFS transporter [Sediminicola luteus]PCE66007.1 hypothetical protein B7P33_01515 [Sediminicola luteus]
MVSTQKYPRKRWLMLLLFMFLTIMVELQWLTHAPIARVAQVFYGNQLTRFSWLTIDTLALVYMVMFLLMCVPASYFLDTYGIRKGIGFGAILTLIGGAIKGFFGHNILLVFVGQLILAVAQPFILNGVTAFSARWFPGDERAMVAGFLALAQYVGIILVMVVTPSLVVAAAADVNYGQGVDHMLWIYMFPTVLSALLFLWFFRARPEGIREGSDVQNLGFKAGYGHLLRSKGAWLTGLLFVIGLGIFNAISSLVDAIAAHLEVTDSDGLIGGIMLIGGIIGALILPMLSDKYQKRKPFLVLCIAGMLPAVAGMAHAPELAQWLGMAHEGVYQIALASSFLLGFFVMSAGPIGFQYMAEITHPTPEATSQGFLLLVGQFSGIAMVVIMGLDKNAYLGVMLKFFVPLAILALVLVLLLKESPKMGNP